MPLAVSIGAVSLSPDTPRIVAAAGEDGHAALATADGADVVEVRADLFEEPNPDILPALLAGLRGAGRPIILTVRSATEGGRPLDDAQRLALYEAGLPHADAIDVEIASESLVDRLLPAARTAGRTAILSVHALDVTPLPDGLRALVERARKLGADVPKVAAYAATLEDLRRLLTLTLAERAAGIVTLAMGPMGPLSRIVLPAAGSLLTYGHVGTPTAPGQLPVAELAELAARLFPS